MGHTVVCRTVTFSKFDPEFRVPTSTVGSVSQRSVTVPGTVEEAVKFCAFPSTGGKDKFDPQKVAGTLDRIIDDYKRDGGWKGYHDIIDNPEPAGALETAVAFWFDFKEYVNIKMKEGVSFKNYACDSSEDCREIFIEAVGRGIK